MARPDFSCGVEGQLDGAWFRVDLGDDRWLPGDPAPRSVAWVVVERNIGVTEPAAADRRRVLAST
jgi:hypothetical protein